MQKQAIAGQLLLVHDCGSTHRHHIVVYERHGLFHKGPVIDQNVSSVHTASECDLQDLLESLMYIKAVSSSPNDL